MIKREKSFLSFSHYVHYTMIKREKVFFWFNHYVNYAGIKKQKVFFPIRHYVDYTMIKRKIFSFILFLRSLHHDQERKKFFFDLVTTLTRPLSRDNFFFHLVPLFTTPWSREICFCISALHSLRQCHQKKKEWFLLHHYFGYATIIEKYPFLVSVRRSLCIYLVTSHYVTNGKVSKRYRFQKNMCNLKSSILSNFRRVLYDLLPFISRINPIF